ncbi:MAG: hypothetical protein ACFFD2_16340 [Promethearchaeota archaeon]
MTLTTEEKNKLYTRRNETLKRFNELLKKRRYLEASLAMEESIGISKALGEIELVEEYIQRIGQCIARIKEISEDIRLIKSDPKLKGAFQDEQRKLIVNAQEATKDLQLQDAYNLYQRALEISLKLGDKKAVWKLSKTITLLEEKIIPSIQPDSPIFTISIPTEIESSTLTSSTPPQIESSTLTSSTPPQIESSTLTSSTPPQIKSSVIQVSTQPQYPVKKEVPFFKTVVTEREKITEKKIEKKKPDKVNKKIKKKMDLADKIAKKKLSEAEKQFIKRAKKEKKEKRKIKEKTVKRKEIDTKKQEKKPKKKIEEKQNEITQSPKGKHSALVPELFAEIKNFDHKDLSSITPQKTKKKKVILGQPLLPADVLEELKKKSDKNSE